ncbi:MAG: hypothetical protein AAF612_08425 [Planctomycetota bacterium]
MWCALAWPPKPSATTGTLALLWAQDWGWLVALALGVALVAALRCGADARRRRLGDRIPAVLALVALGAALAWHGQAVFALGYALHWKYGP